MFNPAVSVRIVPAAAAALLAALAGAPAAATDPVQPTLRVLPYLMNPATDAVSVLWFTASPGDATLTVTGPGLAAPLVFTSTGALAPELDYDLPGEDSATPVANDTRVLLNNAPARNYKHAVRVTGLQPDTQYTYTLTWAGTEFSRTFRTAPASTTERTLRFGVYSDSETLVSGRTRFREWNVGAQAPGSTGRPAGTGRGRNNYFLTERDGYAANIAFMKTLNPDMVIMPGDLIEGTAAEYQRRWDEFWRHNAGQYDDLLTTRPMVAAIGNNCIFLGAGAGDLTNRRIQRARRQWSAYFDFPASDNPSFQDLYHRTDFGNVTILTLCSVKAVEEANHLVAPAQGTGAGPNRDTNRAWFNVLYTFGDMPDFNQGTTQWNWAVQQLTEARAQNRIIFMQWHHTPYSRGVHGSAVTSNQSGEAMRIYLPLAEQFRVAGIFCGHSEVAERSFIDTDNDGYGVNLWDVGFAGDGLRGVEDAPGATSAAITAWRNTDPTFVMNPFHVWSADRSEPELWNGNQLLAGGKHYGFLDVQVTPMGDGRYTIAVQPWHIFPINAGDANFTVTGFEPRTYNDRVVLRGEPNNLRPVTPAACLADITGIGGIGGPDRIVSGDDFIAFIAAFAGESHLADVTGIGAAGAPDGLITGDDFNAFIAAFASGCP
ncbi:MAG: metallophosphoesterase family protein [Planctomycetaceae bacterium]|jgi:hypothetical protein|nr:metallophosphoesterase family protein [Phycisphaerales bacterium]MCE2653365.1 metallophosphoesterase family protein [Planctomycetaceae bacterium]